MFPTGYFSTGPTFYWPLNYLPDVAVLAAGRVTVTFTLRQPSVTFTVN